MAFLNFLVNLVSFISELIVWSFALLGATGLIFTGFAYFLWKNTPSGR